MTDMEEIFKILGIDPSKIPHKSTIDSDNDMLTAVQELHKVFWMFQQAGFSDDQAFELTKIILQRSCK